MEKGLRATMRRHSIYVLGWLPIFIFLLFCGSSFGSKKQDENTKGINYSYYRMFWSAINYRPNFIPIHDYILFISRSVGHFYVDKIILLYPSRTPIISNILPLIYISCKLERCKIGDSLQQGFVQSSSKIRGKVLILARKILFIYNKKKIEIRMITGKSNLKKQVMFPYSVYYISNFKGPEVFRQRGNEIHTYEISKN